MYVPHLYSYHGFEGSRSMSLKVHVLDASHKKLSKIEIDADLSAEVQYSSQTKAEEGLLLSSKVNASKMNKSRNYGENTAIKIDDDGKQRVREISSGHFLEVPDKGLTLKRKDVTFAFWFYVPHEFFSQPPRFMTFLQGHIGIGGYFVITKGTFA